jgi:hypothetical protein
VKVCRVELRLDSLVAFRSRCGSGEIVRLKPDLLPRCGSGEIVNLKPDVLRAFACAHGARAGAECDERTQDCSGGWKSVTWNWSEGWITKTPTNGDLTTWLKCANEPKVGGVGGSDAAICLA